MNKQELLKPLQSGISELVYTDEHTIEHSIMATLAPQHLPDGDAMLSDNNEHTLSVFNVNTEQWETYNVSSMIDVEQLTGEGAAVNETKLQASSDYLEQLDLFSSSDADLDTMEHPDD